MRANRRTNTKPELALRRALHRRGYRYRKDFRLDLEGGKRVRPDIAFTARRVAVFVDGCFWHSCPEHGSRPAVNVWYWDPKLRRNAERDLAANAALAAAGWAVVRIWEHEPIEAAVASVIAALSTAPGQPAGGINRPKMNANLAGLPSTERSQPHGAAAPDQTSVTEKPDDLPGDLAGRPA
jgi:DNA mismatch endonuclease (patch repair protein)